MKALYIIVITGLMLSCFPEESIEKPPAKVLDKEIIVNILYEVELIEAAYSGRTPDDTLAKLMTNDRYVSLFEEYGITDSLFKENYDYYVRMHEMEDILSQVLEKLNTKLTETEALTE